MHLGGKFLYIMRGLPGSRRDEVADLLAGGIAYLSTLMENRGDLVEGVHYVEDNPGAQRHAPCIVVSSDDCFWVWEGEGEDRKRVFRHDMARQKEAGQDCLRRTRVAMQRGINHIIVKNVNGAPSIEIEPYLSLAVEFEYEIIPISIPDFRVEVLEKRQEQSGKVIKYGPDDVMEGHWAITDKTMPRSTYVNKDADHRVIQPPTEAVTESEIIDQVEPERGTFDVVAFTQDELSAHNFFKALGRNSLLAAKNAYSVVEKDGKSYSVGVEFSDSLSREKVDKFAEAYGAVIKWKID